MHCINKRQFLNLEFVHPDLNRESIPKTYLVRAIFILWVIPSVDAFLDPKNIKSPWKRFLKNSRVVEPSHFGGSGSGSRTPKTSGSGSSSYDSTAPAPLYLKILDIIFPCKFQTKTKIYWCWIRDRKLHILFCDQNFPIKRFFICIILGRNRLRLRPDQKVLWLRLQLRYPDFFQDIGRDWY